MPSARMTASSSVMSWGEKRTVQTVAETARVLPLRS